MEISKLEEYHKSHFGKVDYKVWAPGRINLIGEHTDYNNGFVLPAAIDSGITFLVSIKDDVDRFELYSQNLDQYVSFHRNDNPLRPENWAKYLQALIGLIKEEENIDVPGLQISLSSAIPKGGGLSSSAALNAGFILAINEQGNHQWSLKKMAQFAQFTEHKIGARVGIMDPFAILAGKKNNFIQIDCRTEEYTRIPASMDGHVLLLIDTGISHDLADSEYNNRRKTCENVLTAANTQRKIKFVSDLTREDLQFVNSNFPTLSTTEVGFVLDENKRVLNAVKALLQGNIGQVGELMYESHAGLRDLYRVSCTELDFLVEQAHTYTVPGARMMGGGFGGSTINLILEKDVKGFIEYVSKNYQMEYGRIPGFLLVHPADGASLKKP